MSSMLSGSVHSLGSYTQRLDFASGESSGDASSSDNAGEFAGEYLQPSPSTSLVRHYTSLQEHADHLTGVGAPEQDGGLTPRNVSRREGFSWGLRPDLKDQRRNSRNPMPVEPERPASPPPLDECLRRATIVDADHLHNLQNSRLQHTDSIDSQPALMTHFTDSFSSGTSDLYTRNNRRTSIAAFAKGIAKHAHDMKMFNPPERRWTGESKDNDVRRDSQDGKSVKKQERVLSFAPLPITTPKDSYNKLPKPSVVVEEPATPEVAKPTRPSSAAKGSLRDRRKVNLDLSMPTEMPDLPARGRSPVDIMSSLGVSAPRPRSPKTPWIRNEEPNWAPNAQIQKSTPIMEEGYIRDNISALANDNHGGLGLLPGSDVLYSSQSPKFERPPPRVRDRCYISRPQLKRNRSGRSGQSGTSESTLAGTPDGSWTSSAEDRVFQERQASTKAELQQLSQNSKATRSRRWLWKGKTSSEDAPTSPVPQEPSRKFSINLFKRSNRISVQTYPEVSNKISASNKPSAPTSSRLGKGKFQQPSTSLAHVHVPPTFIPPGVHRVPTPPTLDAQGEVRGKLADFFFDVHGGVSAAPRRNKPKSSLGGYWDSDALLMSLTSDIDVDLDDEEDEEGPEGPRTEFDVNGSPGLGTWGGGYLGIKPPASPSLAATSPMLGHDGWFRVSHDPLLTPDDRTLNALARQEEEERRKFEWLVPEHLPNSPLCPLHEKYKGPSQGLCYWHGRRSGNQIRKGEYSRGTESGSGGGGSGQSWGVGLREQVMGGVGPVGPRTPTIEVKKRRLVSLSGP